MTSELAIKILTGDVLGTTEQTHEAINMAVKALSQPEITEEAVKEYCHRHGIITIMSYAEFERRMK